MTSEELKNYSIYVTSKRKALTVDFRGSIFIEINSIGGELDGKSR